MTQKIDNSHLEQLVSDLLDEQITSDDLIELLNNDGVNESFYRFNAVSKVLQGENSTPINMDFVNSVSQKLDSEPAILAPSTEFTNNVATNNNSSNNVIPLFAQVKKLTGGMAIAASVAVATFFSFQSIQVANDTDILNSDVAIQAPLTEPNDVEDTIDPANYSLETTEQKELEFFNDKFMSKMRPTEQKATRAVRGQSVGTIRFSKEQWDNILRRSSRLNQEKKAEEEANQ